MNNLLVDIAAHPSKKVSDTVRGQQDVIDLTVGVPEYGPPQLVTDEVVTRLRGSSEVAVEHDKYADSRGVSNLRGAIAERYRHRYGLHINPDKQVLVTHGAAEAIWLSVFTVTSIGDDVLLPDPAYMLYEPIIKGLGRRPVHVNTYRENDFAIQPTDIQNALTPQAKLLLLNSPANPTGTVFDSALLTDIAEVTSQAGVYVMHDEVFDDVVFTGTHVPLLKAARQREHVIMVNSFSKRFGMTGWRLGWLVASEAVTKEATKAHTFFSLATGSLIQEAVVAAMNDPETQKLVSNHEKEMRKRAYEFSRALAKVPGFDSCSFPSGGFYSFPQVSRFYDYFVPEEWKYLKKGDAVAQFLLKECRIAVVPGSAFGSSGNDHIRISIVAPKHRLDEALKRLSDLSSTSR